MSKIITGQQWRLIITGDIPPSWPSDPMEIGAFIQSSVSLGLGLVPAVRSSEVDLSAPGQSFPAPGQQSHN